MNTRIKCLCVNVSQTTRELQEGNWSPRATVTGWFGWMTRGRSQTMVWTSRWEQLLLMYPWESGMMVGVRLSDFVVTNSKCSLHPSLTMFVWKAGVIVRGIGSITWVESVWRQKSWYRLWFVQTMSPEDDVVVPREDDEEEEELTLLSSEITSSLWRVTENWTEGRNEKIKELVKSRESDNENLKMRYKEIKSRGKRREGGKEGNKILSWWGRVYPFCFAHHFTISSA